MFRMNNEFSMAAMAVLVSAFLHIVVIIVSGGGFIVPMLAGAVGWFLIGAGLQRGWRWLAHIAFLGAMFGGVVAMGYAMGKTAWWHTRSGALFWQIGLPLFCCSSRCGAVPLCRTPDAKLCTKPVVRYRIHFVWITEPLAGRGDQFVLRWVQPCAPP